MKLKTIDILNLHDGLVQFVGHPLCWLWL